MGRAILIASLTLTLCLTLCGAQSTFSTFSSSTTSTPAPTPGTTPPASGTPQPSPSPSPSSPGGSPSPTPSSTPGNTPPPTSPGPTDQTTPPPASTSTTGPGPAAVSSTSSFGGSSYASGFSTYGSIVGSSSGDYRVFPSTYSTGSNVRVNTVPPRVVPGPAPAPSAASVVSATFIEGESSSLFAQYYPFGDDLDYTARQRVAIYSVKMDKPMFVNRDCGPSPYCASNTPMYGVCCPLDGCRYGRRLNVPSNPPGCRCSFDPYWECLNVTGSDFTMTINATRLNPSAPQGTGPRDFLIPIANICSSVLVHVDSLQGDFDMAVMLLYGPRDRHAFAEQSTYGTSAFACAYYNGTRSNMLSLYNAINDKPAHWLYVRVRPKSSGVARLQLLQSPLTGRFVLPVNRYSDIVQPDIDLQCEGPGNASIPSYIYPMPPYPDPLLYYFAQRTGVLGQVDPATLPNDEFTFALQLAASSLKTSYRQLLISPDKCSLNMTFLYDPATQRKRSLVVPIVQPRPQPPCDPALFTALATRLTAAADAYDAVLPTTAEEVARVFAAADALSRSSSWLACSQWGRTQPILTTTGPAAQAVNTTACLAAPFTVEYNTDPCCNRSLEYVQCCAPRLVTPTVVTGAANETFLRTQCNTPACSRNVAEDLLRAVANPSATCDAGFISIFSDPRLTVNRRDDEAAVCSTDLGDLYGGVCLTDAECRPGWSCNPIRLQCIVPFNASITVPCLLENTPTRILTDIYFQIGLTGRESEAVKEAAMLAALGSQGCIVNVDDAIATQDSNATQCLDRGRFCNWATYANNPPVRRLYVTDPAVNAHNWTYECTEVPWLTDHFCAGYCSPDDACYEYSTFPACFETSLNDTACVAAGGVWTNAFPGYWSYEYPQLADLACWFNLTEAACLAAYPTTGVWANFTNYGRYVNTKAECEASGFCYGADADNATACLAGSNCTANDTSAACETAGACSDAQDVSATGSCIMPPPVDFLGRPVACRYLGTRPPFAAALDLDKRASFSAISAAFGCKWTTNGETEVPVNASVCSAFGGIFRLPATNRTDCLAFQVCKTLKGLSTKNATECARCEGGEMVSAWEWIPSAPLWVPFRWERRRLVQGNRYGLIANATKFRELKNPTFFRLASQAAKTAALCKYQSVITPLGLLACDCLSDATDCYQQIIPSFLGITHFCSYADRQFYSAPVGLSSGATSVITSAGAIGCTDVQAQVLTASRYFTQSVTIYSSLFLESIKTAANAVVKNSHGIIVGAVIGNAAVISYEGTVSDVTLCVDLDLSLSDAGYSVYDFASADPATYSVTSFRPRYANVTRVGDTLCTVLSGPATPAQVFFPIRRLANAQKAKFRDTLTKSQQNAFFVATALYAVCFLWTVFRLINIFLWTHLSPERSKFMLQKILLALLLVFFLVRFLYFILVPFGEMRKAPVVVDLLMAELPTYVFFSIFTLMVLWWVELYHNATALQTSLLGRLKWLFIAVNAFLYVFLIIVVAVYAARVNKKDIALCGDSSTRDKASVALTKAYKVIVSVIALVLALGFAVYGTILVRRMKGLAHGAREKLIKFALVAVACTVGLLLQCALLLYSTFKSSASSTSTIVAIILVLLVELLPGGILLATIRQPRAEGVDTWWQDLIWWNYMRASSDTLSRRKTTNSQRSNTATTSASPSRSPTASGSASGEAGPTSNF